MRSLIFLKSLILRWAGRGATKRSSLLLQWQAEDMVAVMLLLWHEEAANVDSVSWDAAMDDDDDDEVLPPNRWTLDRPI